MNKHLIVFVKNPVLGTVKTRLAKTIGNEAALQVYIDLMEKCRDESLQVQAKRHLFYSQNIIDKDLWPSETFEKKLQCNGDLGEKISDAFKNVFEESGKVLIIGSDCYDLSSIIIEEAYKQLAENDVVLGPANDGGYYLLGTKKFYPELFRGINWSTETVLEETILKAEKENLSVALLPELIDIDTIEDLKQSGYNYTKET